MTSKTKKLLNEALQLSPAEREALAGRLFDSLETDDPDAEAAWQAEIGRRIAELDQGTVEAIPWTEARRMIFGDVDTTFSIWLPCGSPRPRYSGGEGMGVRGNKPQAGT